MFPQIFTRTCGPVAGPSSPVAGALAAGRTRGAWLHRWRLLANDGFDLDVPDTPENATEFGYATSDQHRSAYPKARVVAISECGTHAMIAAQVDSFEVGEHTLADRVLPGAAAR